MDKVVAVVVTYNRLHLLKECISALRAQTRKPESILVINNGSTDDTEKWLSLQPDVDFITQTNVGGAGGFHSGIKAGFERGNTWIWLMDDDGYPKHDALENLLVDSEDELCLRNCAVISKEDKKSFVWKTKSYKTIDQVKTDVINKVAHPFNGTMLHRRVIERVGLPNAKLFLWGDETEYYFRIINVNRIPYKTFTKSIHYHPPCAYHYKFDYNYFSSWKMYFYLRNRFSIMTSQFRNNMPVVYTMYILFLSVFATRILIFQKTHKLRKVAFIFWPMKDALTRNFHANPGLILQRLQHGPDTSFSFIRNYFRNLRLLLSGDTITRQLRDFENAKAN